MNRHRTLFYILSLTWGLPLTMIGLLVSAVLLISGHHAKRWGCCWYFEVGTNWGGTEFGPVFLVDRDASDMLRDHELGHGIQNCIFGPLTILLVTLPSAIRYWYRRYRREIRHKPLKSGYYSIWFERQASDFGRKIKRI